MPQKSKLLLIGCGDLPNRMLHYLSPDQWQIRGLRRSPTPLPGVQMSYGDATEPGQIKDLLKDRPEQIVLCLTPGNRTPEAYRNTYLKSAQQLAQAAKRLAPESHLIMVSSTSCYAQNRGEKVNESSSCLPLKETAKVLLASEQEISSSPNPFSIVRFSGIYGPGRRRLLDKVKAGDFSPVDSPVWTNRIHAEDCAAVLAHLLEHPQWSRTGAGILLASDGEPALNTEVENWLAEQMGLARRAEPTEAKPATGKRCDIQRLTSSGFKLQYPNYRTGYHSIISPE